MFKRSTKSSCRPQIHSLCRLPTSTPITVFTGFLGSGKTTIIFSILNQLNKLPNNYNIAILKNEFGDVEVDSELVREFKDSNSRPRSTTDKEQAGTEKIEGVTTDNTREKDRNGTVNLEVTEMLNGCLCCVLVGQMKNALLEMKEKFNPDRIIIESSGSAFPAPIAWQINQLRNEGAGVHLDSIITVIDCVNFRGYEDTSYTAKLQAQYTDLLLLNKSELITPRQLDDVLDHVYALNEDTPIIYYLKDKGIDVDLLFGLDSKLIGNESKSRASSLGIAGAYNDETARGHMNREVDLVLVKKQVDDSTQHAGGFSWGELFTIEQLENWLGTLSKESVYRVKGVIRVGSPHSSSTLISSGSNSSVDQPTTLLIVNHAFGRTQFTTIQNTETLQKYRDTVMKLTFMGVEFGFSRLVDKIENELVKISEGEAGKAVEDFHIEVRLVEAHK